MGINGIFSLFLNAIAILLPYWLCCGMVFAERSKVGMMKNVTKILTIAAFLTTGTAHANTPQWKLSESSGTVNILRAGVSKIAIGGGSLKAGDLITTGKKSRAVLVRGQEYVVISPNSRLRISAPSQNGGVVQFFEELGNVLFRINKKATPHFGVKTPYLAAVVKGTTFSVTVSEMGTAVQVTEGAVQVSTLDGGATQLLSPGMIGMVNRDQQFRLSITGAETRTIDSINAPAGSRNTPEPLDEVALIEIANSSFEGVISAPVLEAPVSLSELTGGLVSNRTASPPKIQFTINGVALPNVIGGGSRFTNGNPGAVGNGNGNPLSGTSVTVGNGNGGSNGANANAGGNGNGNNGVGNGNGNNGVGNGNGGTTGSNANAGGNGGSSNAGGNGNGNNGVGNGNGGPSGGNANAGANAGGNAGANANAGGNGNGNNGVGNGNGGSTGSNANAGGNGGGSSNAGGNGNGNNGVGNGNGGSNGANANAGGNDGGTSNAGANANAGGNGNGNNGVGNAMAVQAAAMPMLVRMPVATPVRTRTLAAMATAIMVSVMAMVAPLARTPMLAAMAAAAATPVAMVTAIMASVMAMAAPTARTPMLRQRWRNQQRRWQRQQRCRQWQRRGKQKIEGDGEQCYRSPKLAYFF